ncbi:hypothetical protein [Hyphomicrobium sp.]|uniref:hypothetical protein n=1 Tax=Hyphomicrobium sp. TaxID=82 RepID=UPI00356A6115
MNDMTEQVVSETLTTKILAIGRRTKNASFEAIAEIRPLEIRATVQLYLGGKIDQWFFRSDSSGVVFLMNCTSASEARDILEKLPLGVEGLMEFELIPLGPLKPLMVLLDDAHKPA